MKTVFEKGRRNNKAVLLVGNTVKSVWNGHTGAKN
jgi:hypothetical protein